MKKVLFTLFLISLLTLSSKASVTIEQITDSEYLINSGYSQAMAEEVFMEKNRVNARPIEPLYEKSQNPIIKGWRKFYSYFDPSQEQYDKLHHDIKQSPSFSDL